MKKLELQQWALIAEVIGGIAVVISIIFLVVETRENTNAIQAQTYQNLTQQLNEIRFNVTTERMSSIMTKMHILGIKDLSDHERWLMRMAAEAKWGIYESAYYAFERGILGESEWQRFKSAICRNYSYDHKLWSPTEYGMTVENFLTGRTLSENITPDFRNYVETLCPAPVVNSTTSKQG